MIERGWYDREFIRRWSNGAHLIRDDTGGLLTERDLGSDGDARRLLAWDAAAGRPVPCDPQPVPTTATTHISPLKGNTVSERRRAKSSAARRSSCMPGCASATHWPLSRQSAGSRATRSRQRPD